MFLFFTRLRFENKGLGFLVNLSGTPFIVHIHRIPFSSPLKALYSTGDSYPPPLTTSRQGIWSIRDDLQVPSSPYFPAFAQGPQPQGPPPMVLERFQSVASFFNIESSAVVALWMMIWPIFLYQLLLVWPYLTQ